MGALLGAEVPGDWEERGKQFHQPVLVGGRIYVRSRRGHHRTADWLTTPATSCHQAVASALSARWIRSRQ